MRHRNTGTPCLDTRILRALGLRAEHDHAFDDAAALAALCSGSCSESELLERIFGFAP